jgi:hypothetical protein
MSLPNKPRLGKAWIFGTIVFIGLAGAAFSNDE